jgi:biopolymer transport protein TolR
LPKVQTAAVETSASSRRGRGPRITPSLSEINVVPLVDVMLVLLIIFMVAAPMMQHGLDVNLPVSAQAPVISSERLYVTVPLSFARDGRVEINDERIPIEALTERIRQAMVNRSERQVYLAGDAGVTLQHLMDVMDRLKQGGVERVGIVARPQAQAR